MNKPIRISLSLLAVLAALLPAGCGRSEPEAPSAASQAPAPSPPPTPPPSSPPVALAPGERLIEITGDDLMKYNVAEIRAKAGETLVVTLKNIGKIPKPAMAHNWVLLKPMSEAEVGAFAMAATAKPPEFLPPDMSAVLAHIKMLGSGETGSVKVTVPSAPGEYPYICTFPGHYLLMRGKMIVN